MKFYKEKNGDYLVIDNRHYRFEGRATCLENNIHSICTTGISKTYLDECQRIKKKDVPQDWLNALL